jgi:DNA (cytosine-5)-methyltransferase 1
MARPERSENVQEIIVDNFAGGGGASTGIELATGRSVDIAINHDPAAIAMHRANHPETEHYCESVWDVDPREVTRGQPVGLCWFSPDCKHFSKAKGGKPKDKNIRGLAWVAVRWAATVRPRVIILENVEEFVTWGPLDKNGYPDPKQKGRTFKTFVNALRRQGYQVEWRELRACDYGAPTIRKRLFLIARCDGRPIVWPKPTHGDPNSPEVKNGKLKPWRTAAEIIDWSLPCPSIFERKRPLAENTLRRIARGIQRFVFENPRPFIVRIGQTGFGGDRLQYSIEQPLTTITTKAEHLLVAPVIARQFGQSVGHRVDEPLGTVTAGGGGKSQLVAAFLAQYHSETANHEARGQTLDRPLLTLDTSNRYALVTSHLVHHPATSGVNHTRAFLMTYYGTGIGQGLDEPLHTVVTKDRFGLVTVHGRKYEIVDIGMRMLEPHELFRAQGFPDTYIIDRDADGKAYPKAAQVARCGNSVPPPFAEALVRANLPEMCVGSGRALAFERYKQQQIGQLAFSM